MTGHTDSLSALALSADGTRIASETLGYNKMGDLAYRALREAILSEFKRMAHAGAVLLINSPPDLVSDHCSEHAAEEDRNSPSFAFANLGSDGSPNYPT